MLLKDHLIYKSGEFEDIVFFIKSLCDETSVAFSEGKAFLPISEETVQVTESGKAVLTFSEGETEQKFKNNEELEISVTAEIAALLKKCADVRHSEGELDVKAREEYWNILEQELDEKGQKYANPAKLKEKLTGVQIVNILSKCILSLQDSSRVYAYSFAADQDRFLRFGKALPGLLYVIESTDKSNAILFSKDEMHFVKLKSDSFQPHILEKDKLVYSDLRGVLKEETETGKERVRIFAGNLHKGEVKIVTPELGDIKVKNIAKILDELVSLVANIRTEEEISAYYSGMCQYLNELPLGKDDSFVDRWEAVALMGERASELSDGANDAFLLEIYGKIKARAKIDSDEAKEKLYKKKIVELTYAPGERNKKLVNIIDNKVSLPAKFVDALGFDGSAECLLEEGKLILSPVSGKKKGKSADVVLEELLETGLSGNELLEAFRLNLGIVSIESEQSGETSEPTEDTEKSKKKKGKKLFRRDDDDDEEDYE